MAPRRSRPAARVEEPGTVWWFIVKSGPSGPDCLLATLLRVCPRARSLHKCMSFKQPQFEWRLSRPKLLVRSCSVVVAQSLPAGFDSVRARVHSLYCLRARAPISCVVVAHSVPGRLHRFDCSLELACQVCWFSAFHASLKLCAPYIM